MWNLPINFKSFEHVLLVSVPCRRARESNNLNTLNFSVLNFLMIFNFKMFLSIFKYYLY